MEPETRKPRVLVVEDSPTQAQELRLILEAEGFEVAGAPDAEQGLAAAEAERFDVVLSDIVLPGMSGYELCRKIKSGPRTAETSVVLLTMLSEPQDVLKGLECGADNFITKPYDPESLAARVKTVLSNLRLRAGETRSEVVKLELEGKTIALSPPPREQLVDLLLTTFEELQRAKECQRAVQPALEATEAGLRERTDLLAVAGNEIRTPMNSILGLTGLLLDTEISLEQRRYLEGIRQAAQTLLKIVNDILDFSKVKAGTLELEATDFDFRETLGNAVKTFARQVREKSLELVYEVRPDVPDALVGDSGRLWQVIVNLLGNAVKFTDRGEVSILVENQAAAPGDAVLKFTVCDTGVGISPERQAALLQRIAQPDNSITHKYSGAGLGLAISSRLVELMGGHVWFESEEGRGSSFHFTARFGLQPAANWPAFAHPRLDGLNVLVVDDNVTSRQALKQSLVEWRAVVAEAASGAEALAALRAAPWRSQRTSVALIDAEMPEMNGFEVLEQIRREPEIGALAVMMLSSPDENRDLDRCRYLGADAYVEKPINPAELQDALIAALRKSVLRSEERQPSSRAPSPELLIRPLHILLVEDDAINQLFAARLLEKAGHTVETAADGKQALAVFGQNAFDLVLMDVQMPVMDGLEAAAEMRRLEQQTGGHVPIIAMTGHREKEDRQACLAAGMDGHVAKPIETGELFAAIAEVISRETKTLESATPNPST